MPREEPEQTCFFAGKCCFWNCSQDGKAGNQTRSWERKTILLPSLRENVCVSKWTGKAQSTSHGTIFFLLWFVQKGICCQTHYEVHIRAHEGRGFPCEYCSKRFSSKQNLSYHMSEHTGQYRFSCAVCSKGFNIVAIPWPFESPSAVAIFEDNRTSSTLAFWSSFVFVVSTKCHLRCQKEKGDILWSIWFRIYFVYQHLLD